MEARKLSLITEVNKAVEALKSIPVGVLGEINNSLQYWEEKQKNVVDSTLKEIIESEIENLQTLMFLRTELHFKVANLVNEVLDEILGVEIPPEVKNFSKSEKVDEPKVIKMTPIHPSSNNEDQSPEEAEIVNEEESKDQDSTEQTTVDFNEFKSEIRELVRNGYEDKADKYIQDAFAGKTEATVLNKYGKPLSEVKWNEAKINRWANDIKTSVKTSNVTTEKKEVDKNTNDENSKKQFSKLEEEVIATLTNLKRLLSKENITEEEQKEVVNEVRTELSQNFSEESVHNLLLEFLNTWEINLDLLELSNSNVETDDIKTDNKEESNDSNNQIIDANKDDYPIKDMKKLWDVGVSIIEKNSMKSHEEITEILFKMCKKALLNRRLVSQTTNEEVYQSEKQIREFMNNLFNSHIYKIRAKKIENSKTGVKVEKDSPKEVEEFRKIINDLPENEKTLGKIVMRYKNIKEEEGIKIPVFKIRDLFIELNNKYKLTNLKFTVNEKDNVSKTTNEKSHDDVSNESVNEETTSKENEENKETSSEDEKTPPWEFFAPTEEEKEIHRSISFAKNKRFLKEKFLDALKIVNNRDRVDALIINALKKGKRSTYIRQVGRMLDHQICEMIKKVEEKNNNK